MNIILIRLKMLESDIRKFKARTIDEVTECGELLSQIEKHKEILERLISEREEIMWPLKEKNK